MTLVDKDPCQYDYTVNVDLREGERLVAVKMDVTGFLPVKITFLFY